MIFLQGGTNMSTQTTTNIDWNNQQKTKNERKFYRATKEVM